MPIENPYKVNGLEDGCRSKIFDSFAESLDNKVPTALARALAEEAYLKADGDPDFTILVDDTFEEHFKELWAEVTLVTMDETDEDDSKGVATLIPNMKASYENGENLLLIGPHGTGKTYTIQQFCRENGITMKYYSCSTLDPYTDLVGVPVPDGDNLRMIRPHDVDNCELIFFDEFNRADSQTMNAVFEIIQFGTINGEPLPKLKCCWAAMNPNDGDYTVSDSDPALIDRFHAYHKLEPKPSVAYMVSVGIDKKVASALIRWWKNHNTKQNNAKLKKERMHYISPRRIEMLGTNWMRYQSGPALLRVLPPNGEFDSTKLIDMLETASGLKIKDAAETAKSLGFDLEKGFIKRNFDIVGEAVKDSVVQQVEVMECLFKGTGPAYIRTDYTAFIEKYCAAAAVETVINNLPATKKSNLKTEFGFYKHEIAVDNMTYANTKLARTLGIIV